MSHYSWSSPKLHYWSTLFLLYINDLPGDVICNIAIYADTTVSILSVISHLICGNWNWLLNLKERKENIARKKIRMISGQWSHCSSYVQKLCSFCIIFSRVELCIFISELFFLDYLENIAKPDDTVLLCHVNIPPHLPTMSFKGKVVFVLIFYTVYHSLRYK